MFKIEIDKDYTKNCIALSPEAIPMNRIILRNYDGSEAIIPKELIPDNMDKENVDLIDIVKHLVNVIKNLKNQRDSMADNLELVCSRLSTDGDCPLFYCCPAKDLGKSCGEITDEDWIYWSKKRSVRR